MTKTPAPPMDIVDTRDTLIRWLSKCETAEQVYLLREVVEDYIVKRFEGVEKPEVIWSAKNFLVESMDLHLCILSQKDDRNPLQTK